NRSQNAMLQAPGDQILHSVVHLIPGCAKLFGGLLPGKFARPMPQKMHVNLGRGVLPHTPRHLFDHHPALLAIDPSHAIDQKNQIAPEADELKPPRRARLVAQELESAGRSRAPVDDSPSRWLRIVSAAV